METDFNQKVVQVYCEALEIDAECRDLFLDEACGEDCVLRKEVESMLKNESKARDFVNNAALRHEEKSSQPDDQTGLLGQLIGPYRILKKLGEGGMGEVFLAEQTGPIKLKVALKLIKLGRYSQTSIKRFELERQILSKLKHPYIAQIHEAGTTEGGQPYFVMEFVDGLPITDYCDAHRFSLNERLDLFEKTCEAIQHAHQKGVIHRDIKPGNVLVAEFEGKPIPKIIDFGVAKAIDGVFETSFSAIHLTRLGIALGTLGYMSPEQAHISDAEVDTRSDVYSLGVLLYELLVGKLPIDPSEIKEIALEGILRFIRERVPEKPSSKIGTLGDISDEVMSKRQTQVKHLRRHLAGDLDWIIMKALEKEKDRRYSSPKNLIEDIKRFTQQLPVLAGPPSMRYQFGKFLKRHKVVVGISCALAASLMFGVFGILRGAKVAREEAATSQQTIEILQEFLSSVKNTEKGREIKVRELLVSFEPRLLELDDQPKVQSSLYYTYAKTYKNLGYYDKAVEFAQNSFEIRKRHFSVENADTISSMDLLADIFTLHGRNDEAVALHQQVLSIRRKQLGPEHPDTVDAMGQLAMSYFSKANYEKAATLQQQVVTLMKKVQGVDHADYYQSLNNLAGIFMMQGKHSEAVPILRKVVAYCTKEFGVEHPYTMVPLNMLGRNLCKDGKNEEGEPLIRQSLAISTKIDGEEHPHTINAMLFLGDALLDEGKCEEAETIVRDAFRITKHVHGEKHRNLFFPMTLLSRILLGCGKIGEAIDLEEDIVVLSKEVGHNSYTARDLFLLGTDFKNNLLPEQAKSCFQSAADSGYEKALNELNPGDGLDKKESK